MRSFGQSKCIRDVAAAIAHLEVMEAGKTANWKFAATG
jgi:hypothetical protein